MCKEENRCSTGRAAAGGERLARIGWNPAEGVANLAEGDRNLVKGCRNPGGRNRVQKKRVDVAQGAPQRSLCADVRREAGI